MIIYTAKRQRSPAPAGSPSECAEVIKKKALKCRQQYAFPKSVNLYKFIRLILGDKISNREIAHRWGIDEKNFYEFKVGRTPVPRLERLTALARVLGVNKHLVFEVAGGASAQKVFNLIRKDDLPGQIKLLSGARRLGKPGARGVQWCWETQ